MYHVYLLWFCLLTPENVANFCKLFTQVEFLLTLVNQALLLSITSHIIFQYISSLLFYETWSGVNELWSCMKTRAVIQRRAGRWRCNFTRRWTDVCRLRIASSSMHSHQMGLSRFRERRLHFCHITHVISWRWNACIDRWNYHPTMKSFELHLCSPWTVLNNVVSTE